MPNDKPVDTSFGILTYAFGSGRYRKQAIRLCQSLRLHNQRYVTACVTDRPNDPELKKAFDILIPFRPEFGQALQQKLHFDLYSPFERTAFIDSDCLVAGNISKLLKKCQGKPFAVLGTKMVDGWWYMDVKSVIDKFRLEFIPYFNGGFYYFEKGEISAKIFAKARQVGRVHQKLGIYDLGAWFNEEVFYALVLGAFKVEPVEDPSRQGMFTPDEFTDPFEIDVVQGYCRFERDGLVYNPCIVHFFGHHVRSFHYLRESLKLRLLAEKHLPEWPVERVVQPILNGGYWVFVQGYKLVSFLRGKRVSYKSGLPIVPFTNFYTTITKRFFADHA